MTLLRSPMYWCFCAGDSVHQRADDPVQLLRDLSVLLLPAPAQHQLCPDPGPALFRGLPHRCALSPVILVRQACCCSQSWALRYFEEISARFREGWPLDPPVFHFRTAWGMSPHRQLLVGWLTGLIKMALKSVLHIDRVLIHVIVLLLRCDGRGPDHQAHWPS